MNFDKKLIEDFTIRYGWTPEAVLTMPTDKIDSMTEEELETYFTALLELSDQHIDINTHSIVDNKILCKSEEEW
ncbi:MAG: hypothetical protein J6L96_01170 [Clostridia bacterium]|nr:hypothetical protein [Clostridia bacterium]